ncbi:unnamed protein product [Effrenium voratum]|nr:unnamed protein product [Effrenium voratum]
MNQLTQGRTCVSARLVQGLNAECVDTALAAMEGDFGARLQLLEAQVGDLQRRVETVSGEAPAGDVLKRLQTVEETISQSSEDKLQGMSAELQASVKAVLQKLEKGLSTLEEATKQQTKQTESTLTRLAKKVEETLQNSALEIGDAALQSLLDQAEKMPRVRPFPADRGVVRQVSHDWQAQQGLRSPSPCMVRPMSPAASMTSLRPAPWVPQPAQGRANLRAMSPEGMIAMAMQSPRELGASRGRSVEPAMRMVRPDGFVQPAMIPVQLSGAMSPATAGDHGLSTGEQCQARKAAPQVQTSPRGPEWLQQPPAALRQAMPRASKPPEGQP